MHVSQTVLLVPMQPTPNGRLHVGHGAGTYLRADVLARALRSRGHQVSVITGSDGFEDWVVAASRADGRTPEETCGHYHAGIKRDLDNLAIALDEWIDPTSAEHTAAYRSVHEDTIALLRSTGAARLETERIPFSVQTGRAVVGTWIAGDCPHCGQPCGGATCTFCGQFFQPEEVVNPRSRLDDSTLEWRDEENWFAYPADTDAILDHHRRTGVRPAFLETVSRYLGKRAGRIHLTGQGTWGIQSSTLPAGKVIANSYYLYSVYCGEIHRRLTGADTNPFAADSGVTTVGLFGSDNSRPGFVSPHVIAQGSGGALKPFDAAVVNAMLHFEGQKCSTSKGHGIWLSELLEGTSISSDELRFHLLHAPLDHDTADVTLDGLVAAVNEFRSWQQEALLPAVDRVRTNGTAVLCTARVLQAVEEQQALLSPYRMDLAAAVAALVRWMHAAPEDPAQWLLGLALLGGPLVPRLAGEIWSQLGFHGNPEVAQARDTSPVPHEERLLADLPAEPLTTASVLPFVHRA
ncbi:methionyl-tRNA synthetase [Kitasatospora sp. MAP12-15]|uniref:class I tRNA ligase family protein n=1 Tax=unclassified Kitasatospora TaxID=2633591 RepID=UPI0024748141|nr:class I tRNA ligase family protein [Kitasatospora sp. MAP12-44]MDH6111841.1 methionyl-tRNA synthetase [Kitasatospora sp. MAP12-44]